LWPGAWMDLVLRNDEHDYKDSVFLSSATNCQKLFQRIY
jgi:hypothetical protein